MRFLRRKWRSVAFRAGLVSALVVGVVASLAYVVIVGAIFSTLSATTAGLQTGELERARDLLLSGTPPADLDILIVDPEFGESFWIVLDDGEEVATGGVVVPGAFSKPFEDGAGVVIEMASDRSDLQSGTKKLDGRDWFVIEDRVVTENTTYRLLLAELRTDSDFGSFFADSLVVGAPLVLLVAFAAGLISAAAARLALRSVDRVRSEVENITQESLDRRVPNTGAGDVVDKLAITMNEMLGRLESSAMQQSQFLADASHELRSPVAGILAQLEVAVMYPNQVDTEVLLPKLKAEAERLRLLVDDLLFLSRSEAALTSRPAGGGGHVVDSGDVPIDELFEAEVDHQRTVQSEVVLSTVGASGVVVSGVRRDLSRAIRNLTNNAVRHASSSVELGVDIVGPMASVTVRDDGEGIDPDDAQRIFERFVRLDEARARDHGGSGLGLAIASEIARQHGGGISVIDVERRGATFQILLPLASYVPPAPVRT